MRILSGPLLGALCVLATAACGEKEVSREKLASIEQAWAEEVEGVTSLPSTSMDATSLLFFAELEKGRLSSKEFQQLDNLGDLHMTNQNQANALEIGVRLYEFMSKKRLKNAWDEGGTLVDDLTEMQQDGLDNAARIQMVLERARCDLKALIGAEPVDRMTLERLLLGTVLYSIAGCGEDMPAVERALLKSFILGRPYPQ